ncbi:cell wall-active antibiotics response protein LiaF [Tumebacillus algifaecis]|nr:cell wall-active antibiotics response protein LiaF [Tumebacillus algifaecis]
MPQNPVLIIGAILLVVIILSALGLFLPFLLAGVGYWLYHNRSKKVGLVLMIIGGVLIVQQLVGVEIIGILVAALLIYIGYRMIKGQEIKWPDQWNFAWKEEPEAKTAMDATAEQATEPEHDESGWSRSTYGGTMIGNLRLINGQFDLDGINASYGVCDVKIDLSKAIIPEGETTLVISALIGDIDIYVPYDLDVTVSTSVTAGNLEVLGSKQGGVNCNLQKTSAGYSSAARKVKISISLLLGDVDVRYL